MPKIKKSFASKFFKASIVSGNAKCIICYREVVSSGSKGDGTTNLINHLKRNHAGNKEVKLAVGNDKVQ